MGLKVTLPGVAFTDTTLPKLYADAIMSEGSLYLVDFSHPGGYDNGSTVPTTGTLLPNIAWEQAKSVIGSGTRTTLSSVADNTFTSSAEGVVEFTGKKGLHIIPSQVGNNGKRFVAQFPQLIKTYLFNNPGRDFYWSAWIRPTRYATTSTTRDYFAGNTAGIAANYLAQLTESYTEPTAGAAFLGRRVSAAGLGNPGLCNVGTTAFTGSMPANDAGAFDVMWKGGPGSGYSGFENNRAKSLVYYRVYLEDLAISGRTYAEVDAIDSALFAAAFGVGGRFNGDTYTAPATVP